MSERNAVFLKEMGLGPRWVLRDAAGRGSGETAAIAPGSTTPLSATEVAQGVAIAALTSTAAVAPLASEAAAAMASLAFATDASATTGSANVAVFAAVDAVQLAGMDWNALADSVAACRSCGLCEGRSNTVFGAGDRKANWLFIGAAPDAEDEAAGRPLAGRSGSLFNNMLAALGLAADQNVYLTNLLKCRPAQNAARPAELAACRPYLERQISLLAPTIIVALGAEVAGVLLEDPTASLSGLRGRLHQFAGLPLVVTYAPQDLLRSPAAKAGAWSDLCLAQKSDVARP